jgi:transcriptional regulator of arginine metabolism
MDVMKQLRQRAIRDLVGQRSIRTQAELAAALRERGFRATQATISRDVGELGLLKATREGVLAYALPARLVDADSTGEDRLAALLRDLPIEFHESGLMLVLRTLPGSAHAIAAALDRARWPGVAGSIAGDDTVFIACRDRRAMRQVQGLLVAFVEGRSPDRPA